MALKTNYKFLFIGDDKNIFVENYSCDLVAEEKEKGGQLLMSIEIRNNFSNAQTISQKVWSTMCGYFSANRNEESYKKFENSLKKVNKVLDELHTKDLNILIGLIVGKDLYITQIGDTAAYLGHKNSIEVISQGLSDKEGNAFTSIVKGKIKVGDFVVFSSVSLFPYISRVDLAKVLNHRALTDSLSKLNKLISTKISGKAGIIGMTFEEVPELIKKAVAVFERLPRKLLAKIKIPNIEIKVPEFLSNIVHSIRNLFLSAIHRKSKLLGIFTVIIFIPILVFGITWYGKNSALKEIQLSTAVIKGQDDKIRAEAILDKTMDETILDKTDNIHRVENPKVYVDFSTKQPNINPLGLLALKSKFFVFEHNKLYEVSLDKIEEIATFEDSEVVVSATDFKNQDSLIFTTTSGKLIQYKNGSLVEVKTIDGDFHNSVAIDDWGDRVYILDSDKNRIWRYSYLPSRGVFKSANWYNIDNDLKDAIDFVVDGLIYILREDADIDQLYKGHKQDFSIENEPLKGFHNAIKIFTEEGLNQIFVMDNRASRIFMYAKDLKTGNAIYNGQFVFPTISGLRDLYVDKNANKLYLLDAQKVYQVEL